MVETKTIKRKNAGTFGRIYFQNTVVLPEWCIPSRP